MRSDIEGSFDRFQLQALIREEQWGNVHRAFDPKVNRLVAIQFLHDNLANQPPIVDAYLEQARNQLRWRQPGIIRILDFGVAQGKVYMIREYIPGPSLDQSLSKLQLGNSWISLSEAIAVILQICKAIEYVHQHGVSLGQFSASNVALKPLSDQAPPYQTVLVSLGFDTNEQLKTQTRPGKFQEIDIRATGKLLFKLVTGKELVEDLSLAGVSSQLRNQRPDLPHSLERVIIRALNSIGGDGYPSIHDLAVSLSEVEGVAQRIESTPAGYQATDNLPMDFEDKIEIVAATQNSHEDLPGNEPEEPAHLPDDPGKFSRDKEPPISPGDQPASPGSVEVGEAPEKQQPAIPVWDETQSSEDTIHILLADQSVRSIPFQGHSMSVGRESDNSIVLEVPGISRHHARFDFDGDQYLVTDLESTNGVFLDDQRLQPGTPHAWLPGENLRMGEAWFRLERAEQELSTIAVPVSRVERELQEKPVVSTSEEAPAEAKPTFIEAMILDSNLSVIPGKSVSTTLVLTNQSTKPDIYFLEIRGVPADWISTRLGNINLPANGQKEIPLVFRPPRSYTSQAGRHSIVVHVSSLNNPAQVKDIRLALTINPFTEFSSELLTKDLQVGDSGLLLIRNLGNIPETFSLIWEDRLGELNFEPRRANATIPPGETIQVHYRVSPANSRWFGGEKVYTYKTYVGSQSAQTQSHTGGLTAKALIPPWALLTLLSLLLVLMVLVVVFLNHFIGSGPNSKATDQATRTLGAFSIQQTDMASTATLESMLIANQATAQAVTATAIWLDADQDLDGLVNRLEIQLNTRPDLADTDGDGLNDGEEVNTYKTNPLLPDSDGDGLSDGEEVLRRTDPLKKDTDGDGLEDAIDPFPLVSTTPTLPATSTLTMTPTASPTASVTPTPTYPPNIADLNLTLTNNTNSSIPGTNTTYTLQVRNSSPVPANNVQVINVFPAILVNPTWNCVVSSGSACQAANGQGNIDLRLNLAPGGTATFTINASISPSASGSLVNSATVGLPPDMSDPNPADNQAMDTDALTPMLNLSISKTDNLSSVEPGDSLIYTIVVGNQGPSAAIGLSVTDYFPDALTDITWVCTASQGSSCAVSAPQTSNILTQVNLSPGGNATFTANAVVRASATGVLTNTVSLVSPVNPAVNNKSATDTTTISPKADLMVSVSSPSIAPVSSQITYTITVTNLGPSNASGITLVDGLPVGSSYSSSDPGTPVCALLDKVLTCTLGDLAAGEERVIKIVISTPYTPGMITNIVNVIADQPDPDLSNNQAIKDILIY